MCHFLQTNGASWNVPTGRRDGRVSSASDTNNLPGFTDSIDVQKKKFSDKGLNTQDLVTLVGNNRNSNSNLVIQICSEFLFKQLKQNFIIKTNRISLQIPLSYLILIQVQLRTRGAHHWNNSMPILQIQTLQFHNNRKWG